MNRLTLEDLKLLIEQAEEQELDLDQIPVILAFQPRWALEYTSAGATMVQTEKGLALYIAEGGQLGYLKEEARDALEEEGIW